MMQSLMNRLTKPKVDMGIAIAAEPVMPEQPYAPVEPMMPDGAMDPSMNMQDMLPQHDESDINAVIDLGPLDSIFEYVEPLAVHASDRELLGFLLKLLSSRHDVLDSLNQ